MRFALGSMPVLVGACVFASPAVLAQHTGSSTTPSYSSVNAILKHPVDDVAVSLEGHIVRKVGKDKYIFSDGTGEIRLEIDRKHLSATPFDEKTKVRIQGEVDSELMRSLEIDVDRVTIVSGG